MWPQQSAPSEYPPAAHASGNAVHLDVRDGACLGASLNCKPQGGAVGPDGAQCQHIPAAAALRHPDGAAPADRVVRDAGLCLFRRHLHAEPGHPSGHECHRADAGGCLARTFSAQERRRGFLGAAQLFRALWLGYGVSQGRCAGGGALHLLPAAYGRQDIDGHAALHCHHISDLHALALDAHSDLDRRGGGVQFRRHWRCGFRPHPPADHQYRD